MGVYTVFSLPEEFIPSTTEFIGGLGTDFIPLIILGFGVALAFFVIPKAILMAKHLAE